MVIKEVKKLNIDYLTRNAKTVFTKKLSVKLAHTRKCSELDLSHNCKNTIEKEPTDKQKAVYKEIFKREKEKHERYIRKCKKKSKEVVVGLV